jgi:hypothetical protein
MEKFDEAVNDCEMAIVLNPNFVKVSRIIESTCAGIPSEGTSPEREA